MRTRLPVLADAIVEYHRVERARKEAAAAALGVDELSCGAMPRLTASIATNRTVQRARPSGGGPHTIATIAACCVLSSIGAGLGRGSSPSACSSPPAR